MGAGGDYIFVSGCARRKSAYGKGGERGAMGVPGLFITLLCLFSSQGICPIHTSHPTQKNTKNEK